MRYQLFSVLFASTVVSAAETYDYIVVGSGPGGGPLAANLARAGYSTLLIEAGGDEGSNPTYADIGNFIESSNDEATRWDFWVKHSEDPARELKFKHTTWDTGDGTFYIGNDPPEGAKHLGIQYPRAAVLGGCAMHNAGVCSLPQDSDWNHVVNSTGDKSWEAPNWRKILKTIEKNDYLPAGNPAHGYNGWLSTATQDGAWTQNDNSSGVRILKKFTQLIGQDPSAASTLINNDILGDYPNKDQISSLYSMATHSDSKGKRSSPNNYVRATLADPAKYPLTLKLHTLATKVLFSNTSAGMAHAPPRAIGVEIMTGPSLYKADPKHVPGTKGPITQVYANKEVIISGGAFNSPQLLKLSGIGPKEELAKFGIPLVKDLPGVGENLGDNYEGSIMALSTQPLNVGLTTAIFRTANAANKNRNIYTWCGGFSFEGFWPGYPTDYGPNQWECAFVHIGPKSQAGTVKLVSADPQDVPDINFRFFENHGNQDLLEIVAAANLAREAWAAAASPAAPFQELHPCPGPLGKSPNCTDQDQADYFKLQAYSHHATSSCSIGADDDPLAVLDSKFRVRGVNGLRVVDASAFPVVPGAFPSLPTMMLSQKATESILEDAKS
ncbi:hypothetical protein B0H63DRAFT_501885 [Podospora didyma]|uniref:Glucose-methanol-choline oxidoreductase N-terminal domain-containing protein n=1 Tax=Podospora didyma TaxID=330526 RepID=A0AAE0NGY8_9PEZI|nr:hypothetical protein B0H63DRAFT_501885 [Podospora didyma]